MSEFNHDYWDCNCLDDYIHHVDEAICSKCGAENGDDQPTSIAEEVEKERAEGRL